MITLAHGEPEYSRLLDRLRQSDGLDEQIWRDAEGRLAEMDQPGSRWSVVLVDGQPAAWCAAREIVEDGQPVIKCHSNYERRGPGRDLGLYRIAYLERHQSVILPGGLPAVTYLFAQPIAPHEADGWQRTGLTDVGELPGHRWWELRRQP